MTHDTKRGKTIRDKADRLKLYPAEEAFQLVKQTATAKFDESVDVAINLGIDPKKSDQTVRGSVVLPKGTGKTKRVAVFAQGDIDSLGRAYETAKRDLMTAVGLELQEARLQFDVWVIERAEKPSEN